MYILTKWGKREILTDKENGIAAFTQEPSSSVAAYGVAGFGVYGVDIWAEADEAEKAVQIIEEIEKSLDTENAE